MKACSASGIAFSLITLGTLQAQVIPPESEAPTVSAAVESNVFTVPEASTPAGSTENGWVRLDGSQGSQYIQQLRERLKDPEQRVLLRAEQRADLMQSHWGVGRALGIDAATESALIGLLADQRIEQFDWFHLRMASAPLARNSAIVDEAARQTRRIEAQRALLGEQRLEQYQAFEKTLGERSQVRLLDSRLDPAHKLTREQTEQLVLLYQTHYVRTMNEHRTTGALQLPLGTTHQRMPSPEELRRHTHLMLAVSNEGLWRRAAGDNRALREQATAFLTAPQLATLSQVQAEQANQFQQRVEQLRAQAGLSPQIPAVPDIPTEAMPARIERNGDAKVSIRLSIDGKEPTVSSQVVRNGGVVTFDVGDGMFVEAAPILYDDGMYDLRLSYHEAGRVGRRLIGEMRQSGDFTQPLVSGDLALSGGVGGSGSVIVGRKAYAVQLDAQVEAM